MDSTWWRDWIWLIESGSVLLFLFILLFVLRRVVSAWRKRKGGETQKQQFFDRIFYLPAQAAIWVAGLTLIIDVLSSHFGLKRMAVYSEHLGLAFVVACLSWIALRWSKLGFENMVAKAQKAGIAYGTMRALDRLVSIVIVSLSLMVIFQIFGINVLPLLAFGGIGVAGIAFAAQDLIANFFGGFMLHISRPFEVGDLIELPAQNNTQGRVEEIGWYVTSLRDTDKRAVYFPNALFSKSQVINLSRRSHYRIFEKIPLRYEDLSQTRVIVEEIRRLMGSHPQVDKHLPIIIGMTGFGLNAAELHVEMLILADDSPTALKIEQDVLLLINQAIESQGGKVMPLNRNLNVQV